MIRRIFLSAAILVSGSSASACGGVIDDAVEPEGPGPVRPQCSIPEAEQVSIGGLRRLSRDQYQNTLVALLPSDALESSRSWLTVFPSDPTLISPGEFVEEHSREHINAVFEIAQRVAETLVADPALLAQIAPPCFTDSNKVDDACLRQTVAEFGGRVVRRPLSKAEVDRYVSLYHIDNEAIRHPSERAALVLAALLNHPELVYHVTNTTSDSKIDAHTLAARISYRTTGGPPDETLASATESGALLDQGELERQARRLLDGPSGRLFVRQLFSRWLALEQIAEPHPLALAVAGLSGDGLADELRDEALDFVEHVIFEEQGSFRDLMTSEVGFPSTDRMASILGVERQAADAQPTTHGRAGLLARPALLVSPDPRTSPIKRGTFIIRRMLCRHVERPEGVDGVAESRLAEIDESEMTARQITSHVTSPSACAQCHSQLNPPGFALESFGPLGAFRPTEGIYDGDGTLIRSLAIDDGVALMIDETPQQVSGPRELGITLAQSEEGSSCAATQVFRATHLREPQDSDACHIAELHGAVQEDLPLFEVLIKNIVAESRTNGGTAL